MGRTNCAVRESKKQCRSTFEFIEQSLVVVVVRRAKRTARCMTALLGDGSELPEISWQASEAVASWRRIVNQTTGDKRPNIERASLELLRLAEAEPSSKRAIVDQLAHIATNAGIEPDEAQEIFARANEPHTSDAIPAVKNLPVAYPLQAFANISLDTGRRNYLVKGLLANSGLAVISGPPKCGKSFWAFDLG